MRNSVKVIKSNKALFMVVIFVDSILLEIREGIFKKEQNNSCLFEFIKEKLSKR